MTHEDTKDCCPLMGNTHMDAPLQMDSQDGEPMTIHQALLTATANASKASLVLAGINGVTVAAVPATPHETPGACELAELLMQQTGELVDALMRLKARVGRL